MARIPYADEKNPEVAELAAQIVKERGKTSRKVFKVKRLTLAARESLELSATISLAVHTTRKPNPGKHAVDVIINGASIPVGSFSVVSPTFQR